jgi:hypothetical protein
MGWATTLALERGMPYAVLCGPAKNAPDLLVGPFETAEEATQRIAGQTPEPGRYMVPMPLTAPQARRP